MVAPASDPVAAETLFQEGRRLLKEGDIFSARGKFAESLRLDPAVGTLANLAECEEALGRTASAWQHWRQAADQMSARDRRRRQALARAGRLEKIVPRIQVSLTPGAPAATRVERDGVVLGEASFGLPFPVDPGHHVVIVSTPDHWPSRIDMILSEGESRVLEVEPGPSLDPTTPAVAPPPTVGARPSGKAVAALPAPSPGQSLVSAPAASPGKLSLFGGAVESVLGRATRREWILAGVGVAGAGAATVFGLQALSARRDAGTACPRLAGLTRCWSSAEASIEQDRRRSLLADLGLIAGVAAAGTATYYLARPRTAAEGTGPRLLAGPRRGGGEVQVVGTF